MRCLRKDLVQFNRLLRAKARTCRRHPLSGDLPRTSAASQTWAHGGCRESPDDLTLTSTRPAPVGSVGLPRVGRWASPVRRGGDRRRPCSSGRQCRASRSLRLSTRSCSTVGRYGTGARWIAPDPRQRDRELRAQICFMSYSLERVAGRKPRPLAFRGTAAPPNSSLVHLLFRAEAREDRGRLPDRSSVVGDGLRGQPGNLSSDGHEFRGSRRHGLQPSGEGRMRGYVLRNAWRRGSRGGGRCVCRVGFVHGISRCSSQDTAAPPGP
jgi:hypothetical protein